MATAAPTGREREYQALLAAAQEAAGGHGSIVFLAGRSGTGKNSLVRALVQDLGDEYEVASVVLYETSVDNPLGPFGEILRALTAKGQRARRILEVIGQVAPPLVELIPVIGKLAALGLKSAATAYGLGAEHRAQQTQLAEGVATALKGIADDGPLVITICDAQWIDGPSTEVIQRLADDIGNRALLIVLAYDDELADDDNLLTQLRIALLERDAARTLTLAEFDVTAVAAVVRQRYGSPLGAGFAQWLLERTDGNPMFLHHYLSTLEQQDVLRRDGDGWTLDESALAGAPTPATLRDLLEPRVAKLAPEDASLLNNGAVQGRRFLSTVLVRMLDRDEREILDALARLERDRRLITLESAEDWWSDRSNQYEFDPGALQEIVYGRYVRTPYERRAPHRAVAEALEALIAGDDPPPRHALMEIARHYEQAGDPVAAGRRLVQVAESTFAEGADRETATTAEQAVRLLCKSSDAEAQQLLARAVVLALLGGEPVWRAQPQDIDAQVILDLAQRGIAAADATGDPALRANTRFAAGQVRIAYQGLEEGIAAFREALSLAREAGDRAGEFAILVNLAHHIDSIDLRQGWELLENARTLLDSGALEGATLAFETDRLHKNMGVAAFDLGRYGQALELLASTGERLRASRRRYETAWAMNFLAQVYCAIGFYEAAEASMQSAIGLFDDQPGILGLRGYLRSFLGHVYVEWEPQRLDRARAELERGRAEALASGYKGVLPLVDVHWAELLVAEGTPEGRREADAVLAASDSYGWARSQIAAWSLRARIALADDRVQDAVELSTRAVEALEQRGGATPATRSEEIFLTHARVLAAAGSATAGGYAARAAKVVRAKAGSLSDPAQRQSFLERVRLSRDALSQGSGPRR
ncbi:MAG TPA: AAA family ATPase [Solirubrobacteraceae bacterium]|nr:AAA family ATPase [Solirubrobacteraceae bacterium]